MKIITENEQKIILELDNSFINEFQILIETFETNNLESLLKVIDLNLVELNISDINTQIDSMNLLILVKNIINNEIEIFEELLYLI